MPTVTKKKLLTRHGQRLRSVLCSAEALPPRGVAQSDVTKPAREVHITLYGRTMFNILVILKLLGCNP